VIEAQPPQAPGPTPYTPDSIDPLIFEEFEGMNTATLRPGVDDKQGAWFDGWMPLARRNLRTMYGLSTALYAAVGTGVAFFDFANIGTTPYAIVFLNNGAIIAVNTSTGTATTIAGAGRILNPSQLSVGVAQYGSKYVLIVSQQTNGYFIWDGTTFYVPGGPLPPGTSYTPTGGSLVTTMPLGISGTAIEIYTGRVWIANGPVITFSAPGSPVDFSSADGGGNFTSTDSFLRVAFIQLKQTNGFLYLIADSSVNYISGVQTSGVASVTTFTNQNADPEVGSPWPNSVGVFSRNILFANAFGAHVSYGGAVTKISEPLDGVYNTVSNFGNIVPSAAKAIIFGKKCWVLLLPIVDPVSGQQVNKLLLTREPVGKIWWASLQDTNLVYIQFQEINSILTAWGTDGISIYQLFARPSTGFTKTAQTKLWDKPGGYQLTKYVTRLWGIVKYYSPLSPALNVALDNETSTNINAVAVVPNTAIWLTASGQVSTWLTAAAQVSTWLAGGASAYSVFPPDAVAQAGVLTGFTLTTNSADMAIVSMMIQDTIAGNRG
jgi:hypothetical protein